MQHLKEWGFHPRESFRLNQLSRQEALNELETNLKFFTEHALEDKPVSSPYYYWPDSTGRLYSHPSRGPEYLVEYQIDPRERGGTMLQGFRALSQALSNPNQMVIHYSPKGKTSFSDKHDDKFEVDSYKDGQLTLQYFDGEKIRAVGLMVGNEDLVFSLLNQFGLPMYEYDVEEERIAYYLLHPLRTKLSLDELLVELDSLGYNDETLYRDKNHFEHTFGRIFKQVHQSFAGNLPQTNRLYLDQTLNALNRELSQAAWTKQKVQETYLRVILNYATVNGLDEVKLMASCGGSIKSTKDIINLLYGSGLSEHLSTDFLNPQNLVGPHSSDKRIKEPFVCPKCKYETTEPVGNQCPSCKITKDEAVKEGYVTC